jgi:hypothetical protein
VAEYCVAQVGPWKGAKVLATLAQWAIASEALGRPISREDYATWWRVSEATSFRHLATFRQAFPHLETPQPLATVALAYAELWRARGIEGFGRLPAAVVTV